MGINRRRISKAYCPEFTRSLPGTFVSLAFLCNLGSRHHDGTICHYHRAFSHYTRRLLLQLLGLVVRDQRVDDRLELAIHYLLQLVDGEADAMIG